MSALSRYQVLEDSATIQQPERRDEHRESKMLFYSRYSVNADSGAIPAAAAEDQSGVPRGYVYLCLESLRPA